MDYWLTRYVAKRNLRLFGNARKYDEEMERRTARFNEYINIIHNLNNIRCLEVARKESSDLYQWLMNPGPHEYSGFVSQIMHSYRKLFPKAKYVDVSTCDTLESSDELEKEDKKRTYDLCKKLEIYLSVGFAVRCNLCCERPAVVIKHNGSHASLHPPSHFSLRSESRMLRKITEHEIDENESAWFERQRILKVLASKYGGGVYPLCAECPLDYLSVMLEGWERESAVISSSMICAVTPRYPRTFSLW